MPTLIPGLRSPYATVGRLVYFGRMLDKIRLHAAGKLPVADYAPNLGKAFDSRCCNFLRINYDEFKARVLAAEATDQELLAWAEARGGTRTDEECEVWNGFMMKRCIRDAGAEILAKRIRESGLQAKPILTMFDYLDFDEGRDPVSARAWELRPPDVVILMGVAGCGKTTVGEKLAATLGWRFRDADDFHPPENVAKMSARVPLTDADRQPWLAAIRTYIEACLARGERAVVTCSALRESYRQTIVADPARVRLAHLIGDEALIAARISQRHGHFMKPEMLKSQLETLEPPQNAVAVDIAGTPAEIVTQIRRAFSL